MATLRDHHLDELINSPYLHAGKFFGSYNDYADDIRSYASRLKDQGIRSKAGYSAYVGHLILMIHEEDLAKAIPVMRSIGVEEFFIEDYELYRKHLED